MKSWTVLKAFSRYEGIRCCTVLFYKLSAQVFKASLADSDRITLSSRGGWCSREEGYLEEVKLELTYPAKRLSLKNHLMFLLV